VTRPTDPASWLDEMGEASLLPPSDPRRQEVEAEVARRGGILREQWLALVEEGERIRLALADEVPPEGLSDRLLDIPRQHRGWLAPLRFDRRGARIGALVAAVLVAGLAFLALSRGRGSAPDPLGEVALLALNDHLDTHTWEVEAGEPEAFLRGLQERIPFPVRVPDLGPEIAPVGGRRCTLGTHVVAFTAWKAPNGRVTLLQVQADDFDLPRDLAATRVRPDGPSSRARPLEVLFVAEAPFAWVAVADDPHDLDAVEMRLADGAPK
jgi:hypothetical protein